jgi:hypothetical protein
MWGKWENRLPNDFSEQQEEHAQRHPTDPQNFAQRFQQPGIHFPILF